MKDLSTLLGRVIGALHADALLKGAVVDAVKECTGGAVMDADIHIKDGVLTISASPSQKNELRLKEARVLERIYEKSGKRVQRIIYA